MSLDGSVKLTDGGNVAADLIISGGGVAVKYNVYLSEDAVKLQFRSTDRGRGELAARLLKLTGLSAEVKSKGDGDGWYVRASTVVLAAAREELRKALAVIIKTAFARGLVDAGKAERWVEKLERGVVAWEGEKFKVWLVRGALEVSWLLCVLCPRGRLGKRLGELSWSRRHGDLR
jgi:hypothetical protein